MKVLCIYHGNCQDGFGAAWAVRHALGDDVEFHPGVYQDAPPDVTGRDVLIVDFSYKRPALEAMAQFASSIVILDHHRTAADDLAGLPPPLDGPYNPNAMVAWQRECNAPTAIHALFDMERSGAGLTWDYFNPVVIRPRLINHIEDRDLWRFKLPNTRAVAAALFSYPYEFELWDRLVNQCEDTAGYQMFIASGEAIERKHHQDIDNLLPVVKRRMVIGGIFMPVANLPLTLTSDAGHKMASEADGIAACYWDTPGWRVFSLRSTDDGPDCQAISVKYGGGGHAHAAGFRMPLSWQGDPP
jgi:oligoribonuclease NrnB/cAMP/cGMP phosphodiesterase (DHH superfamily)